MSKLNKAPMAFTFDDFTLAPQHSEIKSRKDPDTSTSLSFMTMLAPIFSSPMNTVTEEDMLITMNLQGGVGVLHRYITIERQKEIVINATRRLANAGDSSAIAGHPNFFVSVGANGDIKERVMAMSEIGITNFCVDVANGHSAHCLDAVQIIKELLPHSIVMAGNVCTFEGALNLADVGADVLRIGIGNGSMCSTRMVTGHGIPQLTVIEECLAVKHTHPEVVLVADGGIRTSGDMVKALAIGADAVMLGSLLSGTSDTPGEIHKNPETGMLYKYYSGMASTKARESWFDRSKTAWVPEGESTRVPYKGDTSKVLQQLIGGLKVGMSYTGAYDLDELRKKARWVRISPAGLIEGTPHGKR